MARLRRYPFCRCPKLSAGRTATIEALLAKLTAQLGREPTDGEVATVCAISVARVRRHRAVVEGRRT